MCSDWERIKAPAADQIVPYDSLPEATDKSILTKLAVLKVNGGLGTSMGGWRTKSLLARGSLMHVFRHSGMTGAKSALEVKDDMTFLDLTVRQIEVGVSSPRHALSTTLTRNAKHLNTENRVDVPLILMTSFNTHGDTLRIIKKYANQQLRIVTFNQSRYPRIFKESLLPCPQAADDNKKHWCVSQMTPTLCCLPAVCDQASYGQVPARPR